MKKIKFTRENILLSLILILSSVLNFANIGIEGYANQYYAAGVKSMTMSLKNFFFVSFDPAGFVSIDKPPLGFWIQAISAKIFGFHGWSILLPEALAGVISVAVLYHIVKRSFGTAAGLLSALCLAITPVFVAVSRNNTIDNLLVLALLFACWALLKAAEKGKLKYLIISMVFIGLGFNIKMLQAYMVAPAIYVTYLLTNAASFKKRLIHLAAGTLVLLIVSLSWAAVVDMVPASDRPFVGSSSNNTVMELIMGHNGLERLESTSSSGAPGNSNGRMNRGDGAITGYGANQNGNNSGQNGQGMPQNPFGSDGNGGMGPGQFGDGGQRFDGGRQNGPGGQGGTFGGSEPASIVRLFSNNSLSDQIIWLLPLALFGLAAAALQEKSWRKFDNGRKHSLLLWIVWLVPMFIYFSFTKGLFHPYYLTMMAPPIAALSGIGIVSMWQLYKEGGVKSWLLPAALLSDALVEMLILSYYSSYGIAKVIMAVVAALCLISSVVLAVLNLMKKKNIKLQRVLACAALIGLLAAPAVWSGTTLFYTESGTFPSAGLSLMSSTGQAGNMSIGNSNSSNAVLVNYLISQRKNEKYLVAVSSANSYASEIIIQTGQPVMTLGGFSGSDNILTLAQFKAMVAKGEIRFVLAGGMGGNSNSEIMNWVEQNGKVVDESTWNGTSSSGSTSSNVQYNGMRGGNSEQLYDLKDCIQNASK